MIEVIITGVLGIGANFITWILTKKKYNTEVDKTLIENMEESLEFYKTLSNDNKERLDKMLDENKEIIKQNDDLRREISSLKTQLINIMASICVDLTCKLRKRDLSLFNRDGTKTQKNRKE